MKNAPASITRNNCPRSRPQFQILLAAALIQIFLARSAWANVYATNLRFNGGTSNVVVAAVTNIGIGYVLNEPATAGVLIKINSGETTIRSITVTNPNPGTLFGTNLVVWDGKDDSSVNVGPGTYTISVTASTSGFDEWNQTGLTNVNVWEPSGIAVNKNASSPYYGRVFVANSAEGPNPDLDHPGDLVGIQKLNADGSPAEEGSYTNGGWNWAGDTFSPWKIEVAADDEVYIDDLTAGGVLLGFDQTLSSASRRIVLNTNNYPSPTVNLSGPFITGAGTNTQVWMADTAQPGSVGIRRWQFGTNGAIATNNLGATIIQAGSGSNLDQAPFDVAVDRSNRVYSIQYRPDSGDPAYRVFRFPAYGGTSETNADWKIGNSDDSMQGAYGVAVDPAGRYLAVAFIGNGLGQGGLGVNGSAQVFEATNGASVITFSPASAPAHPFTDVAWDAVGNLYALDEYDGLVRVYSPPGSNQATTAAVVTFQIGSAGTPARLSAPMYGGGQFQFTLNGEANVSYIIQTSTNLQAWIPVATNVSANATRPISLSAPARLSFYRAFVGP